LWLVDATYNQPDPESGNTFAVMQDLNLNDFFFKYGLRINPNLVQDVYSAPIVLASGQETESTYNRYPWFYYPLSVSSANHPVVKNLEAVKFEYTSGLDTLANQTKKTILLSSSPLSQLQAVPAQIDMDREIPRYLEIVNQGPKPGTFDDGEIPLAVLLEGNFGSAFLNRIKPFKLADNRDSSVDTRMIVIGDAQVIANQLDRGRPIELGFDKWTQTYYGNKEFLLNCVNYLLDESGLINIRSREVKLPFLDQQKVASQRGSWQALNLLLPTGLLLLFGLGYNLYRKRHYGL
jgi:gliding-associated putative ABC transporter substrate-binding component GldG